MQRDGKASHEEEERITSSKVAEFVTEHLILPSGVPLDRIAGQNDDGSENPPDQRGGDFLGGRKASSPAQILGGIVEP